MKISERVQITKSHYARNRIVLPPMDTLMAKDGVANDFHIQHYGSKAYGGVGTIIVESTAVSPEGVIRIGDLGLWDDKHIAPLKKVSEIIKAGGAVAGIQLNHAGAKSEAIKLTRYGTTMFYTYIDQKTFKMATLKDLKRIEDDFVKAAQRAKAAGFDFVEIHAAHGYLLSELVSNLLNDVIKNPDMSVRAEMIINIARRIRETVKDLDVTIRFSVSDYDPNGVTPKDFAPLVKKLDPYIDVYHISSGVTVNMKGFEPGKDKLYRLPLAIEFRKLTKKNLIVGGNFDSRADVQRALDAGIELVGIGRALINNPNLTLNTIVEPKDIDDKIYPWNDNPWFANGGFNRMMEMVRSTKK